MSFISSCDILSQEIYTLTTILESLDSSAIPQSQSGGSFSFQAVSPPNYLSHLFVPQAKTAAAVSTVFSAQHLDLYVAIDDKRDPRQVAEMRSDYSNGAPTSHFAIPGSWLGRVTVGESNLVHEIYIQYLQRALPRQPDNDPVYLVMSHPEADALVYLFCSRKLEQRFLKTRALPEVRAGTAMIDALHKVDTENIKRNFISSLDDVDINIQRRDWKHEGGWSPFTQHKTLFTADGYTLSHDVWTQIDLWDAFLLELFNLEQCLLRIRKLEKKNDNVAHLIDILRLVSDSCIDLTYFLNCKSFHRLLQNQAIVSAVLQSALTNKITHKQRLTDMGAIPVESDLQIEDLDEDDLDEDEEDDRIASAVNGANDKSRVLTLITSWLEKCVRISSGLHSAMNGRIPEYLLTHGLRIHLLDNPCLSVSPRPLLDLLQHLTRSTEYQASKLADVLPTADVLLAALLDKVPHLVRILESNTAKEKHVHCQSALAATVYMANVRFFPTERVKLYKPSIKNQPHPPNIDISSRCCFCCSWLLSQLGLEHSTACVGIRTWVPPLNLDRSFKEMLVKELWLLFMDRLWTILKAWNRFGLLGIWGIVVAVALFFRLEATALLIGEIA